MIVKTNDFQTIVECSQCSYTYTIENENISDDIEECFNCGFVGILDIEQIDENTDLKICRTCGHNYTVTAS
jgi:hypothetical protein